MKKVILTLVFVSLTHLAAGQSPTGYRMEGEARGERTNTDTYHLNNLVLKGSFYFDQIEAKKGPLNETAFLERIGYAEFLFKKGFGKSGSTDGNPEADLVASALGGKVRFAKPKLPIFFSCGILNTRNTVDVEHTGEDNDGEETVNEIEGEIGYFFVESATVSFFTSYRRLEFKNYYFDLPDEKLTVKTNGVKVKWVLASAANIEAGGELAKFENDRDEGSNRIFFLGADLYFNRRLSVGGEVEINIGDYEVDEGKTYALRTKYFINPKTALSLDANIFRADNDDRNDDVLTGALSVVFRY